MKNLSKSKVFQQLPDEMLKKYVLNCQMKSFEKKEIAFTPYSKKSCMYLLLSGRVRVSLNYPNGKEFTVAILEKGDVYSGHARGVGVTLEKAEIAYLPLATFRDMIMEYPSFALNVLAAVGSTLQLTFNVIEDLVFRDVNERVYSYILSLVSSKGIVTTEGVEISLGLTQEEIATVVGSTRLTVNTILTQLQKQKIISISKKKIIVHDLEKLRSLFQKNS